MRITPEGKLIYRCILIVLLLGQWSNVTSQETSIPQFPEWMIQKRMEALNYQTPIQLDYNKSVQAYIDVYTVKKREHLANIISRSKLYFPLFEEYLDKYDLPLELKYLAVIESALDPRAKSPSGAMGLWQFLYHSGTMFDLKVSTYVDERSDPVLSTEAACKYLEYLYRIFDDWQLALAAYNGGAGVIKKAIERSGGITDYWQLRPYLPEQVKGYVPAFIAANYSLSYFSNYDIQETPAKFRFNDVDTVFIQQSVSLKKISSIVGISMDDLTFLNPVFTKETIPVNDDPVRLFIPEKFSTNFVQNEHKLYNKTVTTVDKTKNLNRSKIYHTVSKGEYFHKIAIKYNCTLEEIIEWNNLTSTDIHPGQQLIIWKTDKKQRFFFIKNEVNNLAELK
ncbi:LysM peptidoglycan-binding domain-containing protein [Labilibacter sediminis]|nr:LysM peptidoglycan-binding domain-containing protein [Labilibacter sediminis]